MLQNRVMPIQRRIESKGKMTATSVLASLSPRIQAVAKRNNKKIDNTKMVVMAQAMLNMQKMLKKCNISVKAGMTNSVGTETGGLAGHIARFVSLLNPEILVNLTAYDHAIVFPMKTRKCAFVYPRYTYGTNKGQYRQGELIRDIYKSSNVSPATFIGPDVQNETYTIAVGATTVNFTLETPNVIVGTETITVGTQQATRAADGSWSSPASFTVTETAAGVITVTLAAAATAITPVYANYKFNNEAIPRPVVPTINVELETINLSATFYQIQIMYDVYADFEADNDYGFSISKELPTQAALEVKAEIDRLVYDKLYEAAASSTTAAEKALFTMDFTATPDTADFKNVIETRMARLIAAATRIFGARTNRVTGATSLIFGLDALAFLYPIIENAQESDGYGCYKLGVFRSIGIYIDPTQTNEVRAIFKAKEGNRAPVVLGEYMGLVPTNPLNLPDFTSAQGFATACDVRIINDMFAIEGAIVA